MDPTCVDVTGNLDALALVLVPRGVLFVCDLLRGRYAFARRVGDALGTLLGGRHERFAKPNEEGKP